MSEQTPDENQDLAQVLNRINALMKHGEQTVKMPDDEIPLLTEVYEGAPLTFTSDRPKTAAIEGKGDDQSVAPTVFSADITQELLKEMLPLIHEAVRKAVQQELAKAEQRLTSKIEADLVTSLQQRLQPDS